MLMAEIKTNIITAKASTTRKESSSKIQVLSIIINTIRVYSIKNTRANIKKLMFWQY